MESTDDMANEEEVANIRAPESVVITVVRCKNLVSAGYRVLSCMLELTTIICVFIQTYSTLAICRLIHRYLPRIDVQLFVLITLKSRSKTLTSCLRGGPSSQASRFLSKSDLRLRIHRLSRSQC